MKVTLLAMACALASCAQHGDRQWLNTGRDERVFNPATGRYDWPDDAALRRPQPPVAAKPATAAPPDEGARTYNPATGRWE